MRMLNKNKQKLHYALLVGEVPVYKLDSDGNKIVDYIDEDGNEVYLETGGYELEYSEPVSFYGNASMSSGESQPQEYGVDVSQYDAILVLNKNEIPITETSILWCENEPSYKDADKTIVDGSKADYKVLAIKPSLNQLKVILGRITK